TINLSASGMATVPVTANVTDDDMQVVVASAGTVNVTEQGAAVSVGISLMYMPSGNVTVNVASALPALAGASPSSLTFMPGNYSTPQNIMITGTDDADAQGGMTTVTASATSATSANITVNVTDNDTLGLETSVPMLTIGEAGTGMFGVRLTAAPPVGNTVTV